jgi:hypothetical protein
MFEVFAALALHFVIVPSFRAPTESIELIAGDQMDIKLEFRLN